MKKFLKVPFVSTIPLEADLSGCWWSSHATILPTRFSCLVCLRYLGHSHSLMSPPSNSSRVSLFSSCSPFARSIWVSAFALFWTSSSWRHFIGFIDGSYESHTYSTRLRKEIPVEQRKYSSSDGNVWAKCFQQIIWLFLQQILPHFWSSKWCHSILDSELRKELTSKI